eukprot:CAMPEP_0119329474 /NCGR_PEP_ID=MMETSP1333-20130426/75951_1 /TAXON_ID=418940 /ORGANISM="Scyphosphaera apsteinii, Strain RCC1455" /LENGTH=42 /DNA_ID= /DNA_START= /DNA_END= /DNA_ORIENTATION=
MTDVQTGWLAKVQLSRLGGHEPWYAGELASWEQRILKVGRIS